MKKNLLLLLIAGFWVFVPVNLFSQEQSPINRWSIGVTTGPQFTKVSSVGLLPGEESGIGFLTGAFVQYDLLSDLHIRVGSNFDKRNFKLKFQTPYLVFQDSIVSWNSYSAYDLTYNIDYLTIPLSIIYTKGEGNFKLFVQGTFYYSVYLGAHKKGFTDIYIDDEYYQYVDHENYPELNSGHNREDFSGSTEYFIGDERFNSSDIGLSFFIGGFYKLSEKVGLYLSPGFTTSFGRILENPVYDSKWVRVFKIETGVVIHLN